MQRHFSKNSITFTTRHLQTTKPAYIFQQQTSKMTTEAQAAKKHLRKEIKARLSTLSAIDITSQSSQAQHLILGMDQYKQAKSISIYLSMPAAEAQTDLLVRDALESGKKIFVPFLYSPSPVQNAAASGKPRKIMDMLRLGSVAEYDELSKDAWGIPSLSADGAEGRENVMGGKGLTLAGGEASESEDEGGLDMVVVPAVAYDVKMGRLGHGGGFYDAFLTRFCEQGRRPKPYLGKIRLPQTNIARISVADFCTSRSLPSRADTRTRAYNSHSRLGLESRCRRCRQWNTAVLNLKFVFCHKRYKLVV